MVAALTTSGLQGAAESSVGSVVVGLRPTAKVLAGSVVAGGRTLGLLVLLRAKRPPAVTLIRWLCSWSKARSSRRWVRASFCWMAIRRRELRVFFSSSAAASCLCISSSWDMYSSHLRREGSWHDYMLKKIKCQYLSALRLLPITMFLFFRHVDILLNMTFPPHVQVPVGHQAAPGVTMSQ